MFVFYLHSYYTAGIQIRPESAILTSVTIYDVTSFSNQGSDLFGKLRGRSDLNLKVNKANFAYGK